MPDTQNKSQGLGTSINSKFPSFPRRRESKFGGNWIPAFAGTQYARLDSRLRGNDGTDRSARIEMRGWLAGLVAVLALAAAQGSAARETSLTLATDLTVDLKEATKRGVPLLVLVSLAGCPQCEIVRRGHLTPMSHETPPRAIIRQVNLQSTAPLRDFDGSQTTQKNFIDRQKINFAPTVVIYGSKGRPIGEPLVGTMLADFYSHYLESSLAEARKSFGQADQAKNNGLTNTPKNR